MITQASEHLRRIRCRLGITTRQVEVLSRQVAEDFQNEEFFISHARIVQVEGGKSTPSIYKLCTLSTIYNTPMTGLLDLYVDLEKLGARQFNVNPGRTRLIELGVHPANCPPSLPVKFDPACSLEKTDLLSRMVEVWGEIPMPLLQRLDLKTMRYGFIGLEDYTLYPLLRPGSFVQIDNGERNIYEVTRQSEFDRPIHFIELRDGYACGWCEVHDSRLFILPHPLSPCRVRNYAYPRDAEIIGRVTAVAARIVTEKKSAARFSASSVQ